MKNKLIKKEDVLDIVQKLFLQEHETLKAHPKNEQNIIGNKLAVIGIELAAQIKELKPIKLRKLFLQSKIKVSTSIDRFKLGRNYSRVRYFNRESNKKSNKRI